MKQNLIYVFNDKDKEMLEEHGYLLLKSDESNCTFIFLLEDDEGLESLPFEEGFIRTNSLSF